MYARGTPSLWPMAFRRGDNSARGGASNPNPSGPRSPEHPIWKPESSQGRRRHRYRRFKPVAMSVSAFDRKFWRHVHPDLADREEQDEKALETARDKMTIKPEEADKVAELTVSDLDLHAAENSKNHHTTKYSKKVQPVLRRGQEFVITLTFDRDYRKDKDNLFFIFKADDDCIGKNLYVEFQLDEADSATYRTDGDWGARMVEAGSKKLKAEIYIPGDCVVGRWDLEVKTSLLGQQDDFIYESQQPLYVLFNPWSAEDQVHYTEEVNDDNKGLEEYILNQTGAVFRGSCSGVYGTYWDYDQFDDGILEICMHILRKAFGFKMTPAMGDAVRVARALSCIVNSCDNQGVLVGNWSGNYDGGESPSSWQCSADILEKYRDSERPVKFGQCWVFSHLLTAVCRALGLPCRSVTNFNSAHDTDNTCTIDDFKDEEGNEVNMDDSHDSVWNFHVWNEVWVLRPDLDCATYDGWHVIDATPQESSLGIFQCGPCPVVAVRRGDTNVGHDTGFVFSEVNADRVHWKVMPDRSLVVSGIEKHSIGQKISTKKPDGGIFSYGEKPLDLTLTYKAPEGSDAEREAVKKAVRFRIHGRQLYKENADFKVNFEVGEPPLAGQDVEVKVTVQNATAEDKTVAMLLAARTCRYWDKTKNDKHLAKEKFPKKTIKAGQTEKYHVTIPGSVCMDNLYDDMCLYAYACATDAATAMPYSAEQPYVVRLPDLSFQGPKTAKSGETVTVAVSLTNCLLKPLTKNGLSFCGRLDLAADDKNTGLKHYNRLHIMDLKDKSIPAKETFSVTLRVLGTREADDEEGRRTLRFSFFSQDLPKNIEGVYVLNIEAPPPAPVTTTTTATTPAPVTSTTTRPAPVTTTTTATTPARQ